MTSNRFITGVLSTLMLVGLWPFQIDRVQAAEFSDTAGHRYEDSINFLAQRGILEGYEGGVFNPDKALIRVEMLKILMEDDLTDQDQNLSHCFEDVTTEWYAKYVCRAKEDTIVQGYEGNLFHPGREITMVEGLKIAIEYFGLDTSSYPSDKWYRPYVELAHDNNLFSKYSYLPERPMTRAEMAFLVHQLTLNQEGIQALETGRRNWSAGCGQNPPGTPPSTSMVNGIERSYITVIPNDYDQNTPKKIIFAFHGRTNSNEQVRGYYKVEQAAGNDAIMVYPSGLPTNSSPRNWADAGDSASNLRDYAFFDQLLEEFSNNYCLDLDEVYVVGHSLGAWFTNSLACFRGDVIRGVGTLGGGTSMGECAGPVATIIMHNPNDNLAPFSSGELARDQYISQNQCQLETVPAEPAAGNCVQYEGCYADAPLIWCPHTEDYASYSGAYYPHTWPDFTGAAIWDFFQGLD